MFSFDWEILPKSAIQFVEYFEFQPMKSHRLISRNEIKLNDRLTTLILIPEMIRRLSLQCESTNKNLLLSSESAPRKNHLSCYNLSG